MAKYSDASRHLERSIEIDLQHGAKGEVEILSKQRLLALLHKNLADYEEALTILNEVLNATRLALGEDRPKIGVGWIWIGVCQAKTGRAAEARASVANARALFLRVNGPDDRNTMEAEKLLQALEP